MTTHQRPAALAEVAKLKSHFSVVLTLLRANPPARLDPAQRLTRALLLDELERYAAEGAFPQNRHTPERAPVFIDHVGTRCAVAHLMDVSGLGALALEVRDRTNFAVLPSIAEDPRVVSWLEAAGLTAAEAALIQPSYCFTSPSSCLCDGIGPLNETALVIATPAGEGRATVAQVLESKLDGVAVGAEIDLRTFVVRIPTGSDSVVLRVQPRAGADAGGPLLVARSSLVGLSSDTMIPCSTWGVSSLPLSKTDALAAIQSADPKACGTYLASLDKEWTITLAQKNPTCGSMAPPVPPPESTATAPAPTPAATAPVSGADPNGEAAAAGCDLGGLAGSAPTSLAVLAAVVGAIAARRVRG